LSTSNKLNEEGEWIAKMAISCRSEYVGRDPWIDGSGEGSFLLTMSLEVLQRMMDPGQQASEQLGH